MAKDFTILVGTKGAGLFRSPDGGGSWGGVRMGQGHQGKVVHGVALSPCDPYVLYAGAEDGLYRSADRGKSFDLVDSPMNGVHVHRVAVHPEAPDVVYAATIPAAVFRSKDRGKAWERLALASYDKRPFNVHRQGDQPLAHVAAPIPMALTIDPTHSESIWLGVEVDGLHLSRDGGETWRQMSPAGLREEMPRYFTLDIHDVKITKAGQMFIAITMDFCRSRNGGESWDVIDLQDFFDYPPTFRALAVKEDDPNTVFVGVGVAGFASQLIKGGTGAEGYSAYSAAVRTPAEQGAVVRSTDGGKTWSKVRLPVAPNSQIDGFATHPSDPNLILAYTSCGQIFASADGGDWWIKLPREFTDLSGRGVAWFPN